MFGRRNHQGGEKILLHRAFAAALIAAASSRPRPPPGGRTASRAGSPPTARPPRSASATPARPSAGRSSGDGRGRAQSAYQVVVTKGGATVWDSGEVHSPASANVPYGGSGAGVGHAVPLEGPRLGRERAAVASGARPRSSRPACSPTRLDRQVDRRARGRPQPLRRELDLVHEDDAAATCRPMTRFLRATVHPRRRAERARLLFTVDDEAAVYVNGTLVADTKAAPRQRQERLAEGADRRRHSARSGANTIAVQVKNRLNAERRPHAGAASSPPARPTARRSTRRAWKSSATGPAGWQQPAFDDSAWTPARELATYGSGRGAPRLAPGAAEPVPAQGLHGRREPIAQARLYVSALGVYEVHINGHKVGDQVLAPGWTEYTKRVPSQTYDVTGPGQAGRQRDRRGARRRLVRRPPPGRPQVGHARPRCSPS